MDMFLFNQIIGQLRELREILNNKLKEENDNDILTLVRKINIEINLLENIGLDMSLNKAIDILKNYRGNYIVPNCELDIAIKRILRELDN